MAFDPYHKWLGIPPADQPPNHYRLLAIGLFEDDSDVIETAADQRMGHLRTFQTGPHSALSQKLLNELAGAKLCLLNSEKKAPYDADLRCRLVDLRAAQLAAAVTAPPPASFVQPSPPTPQPLVPVVVRAVNSSGPRFEPPPLIVTNARQVPYEEGTARSRLSRAACAWLMLAAVAVPAAIFVGYLISTKGGHVVADVQVKEQPPAGLDPREREPTPERVKKTDSPGPVAVPDGNSNESKRFPFEIPDPQQARWRLDGDELVQSSRAENISIIFGNPAWEDVDFSVEAQMTDGNDLCGMFCRYQDEGNVERLALGSFGNTWHICESYDSGVNTGKGNCRGSLLAGKWYRLEFRMRGKQGECFLDGEQMLSFETERHGHGRVGLQTWGAAYRFRNIIIKSPDGDVLLEGLPDLDAEPPSQAYEDDYRKVLAARGGALPVGSDGRALNLDFEAGNLQDWTVEGDAFTGQPVKGDTLHGRYKYARSRHSGQFWVAGGGANSDSARGTMTSLPFRVTKPFASFLMAGGGPIGVDAAVELLERDASEPFLRVIGNGSDTLQPVVVDLTQRLGKEIVIRLTDRADGPAGHISFDDFRLHDSTPDFSPQYVRANALPFGQTTDVLNMVDMKRDSRSGAWHRDAQNRLVVPIWGWKMLQVPVHVPGEYDLAFAIEGFPGLDAIHVILPVGDHQTLLKLNGWSNPIVSGLERIDGSPVFSNESTHRGAVLLEGKPNKVLCQVRAGSIKAICNGETIFDWHGDFNRLSLPWGVVPPWATVAGYHGILIGGRRAGFRLSQLEITAIGSESKATAKSVVQINCSFRNDTESEVAFVLGDKSYRLAPGKLSSFPGTFDSTGEPVVRILQVDGGNLGFFVSDGGDYAFRVDPTTGKIINYYR